jgi:hypothetical protein
VSTNQRQEPTRVTIILTPAGHVRSVFADGPVTCVTTSEYLDQKGKVAGHSKAVSFPVHREDCLPKTVRGWSARIHSEERRLGGSLAGK